MIIKFAFVFSFDFNLFHYLNLRSFLSSLPLEPLCNASLLVVFLRGFRVPGSPQPPGSWILLVLDLLHKCTIFTYMRSYISVSIFCRLPDLFRFLSFLSINPHNGSLSYLSPLFVYFSGSSLVIKTNTFCACLCNQYTLTKWSIFIAEYLYQFISGDNYFRMKIWKCFVIFILSH